MNTNYFRQKLKERMREDGVTQNFLAKKYGIKQSSLSRFLNEERELPGRCFLALFPFVFQEQTLNKDTFNAT